jgi:hypothetical protein
MTSRDGTLMTRAFRDGVENKRKVRAPVRMRTWNPIRDLRGLKAMIRIENEHWVFERIEDGVLQNLTHRLIVHDSEGEKTLGATIDLKTAMQVAKRMATKENKIIMIKPL